MYLFGEINDELHPVQRSTGVNKTNLIYSFSLDDYVLVNNCNYRYFKIYKSIKSILNMVTQLKFSK